MDINITYGIIIAICIALSAFFSCTETAYSCASTARLKSYSENGNKKAKAALYICDNYDRALTAILIGNNIVNLGCSALATVLCINLFGDIGAAVSTGATTLLVLTFGEVIPKCFGKEKSEAIALNTAYILRFLLVIFYPFIYLFMGLKSLALKLANVKSNEPSVTEDELKYIIESIEEEGVLEEQESEMVQSALEFDEKTALEILTPRVDVTAINIDESIDEITKIIMAERYSRIPVYRDSIDNVIGILHTRDYLESLANNKTPDVNALIQPAYFIYKSQKLSVILNEFKRKKLHFAIVTDEYGGVLGIVTMEDLLEEIVGEIWDEDEEIESLFTQIGENKYIVSGDMELPDLFALFEINDRNLETDSITVGGFISEQLGTIPKKNDILTYNGLKFTVEFMSEQRVISAVIEKA